MTTYSTISNPAVAVGGIPSSATVTALRDNPIAIAESASGAPILSAGWHPYDKVSVGDGTTGLLYDHTVNGTQATITTPDFEDGWEYKIVGRAVGHTNGTARSLYIKVYSSSYIDYKITQTTSNARMISFEAEIYSPRVAQMQHVGLFVSSLTSPEDTPRMSTFDIRPDDFDFGGTSPYKLLRAQLTFANGVVPFAYGKVWCLRRRCYRSL